jgi:hypothetical protein
MSLVLNLKGLAAERAWYLYKHIREKYQTIAKTLLVQNTLFQIRNPLKFLYTGGVKMRTKWLRKNDNK